MDHGQSEQGWVAISVEQKGMVHYMSGKGAESLTTARHDSGVRLFQAGAALTKSVIGELDEAAWRILDTQAAVLRKKVQKKWRQERRRQSLYFIYANNKFLFVDTEKTSSDRASPLDVALRAYYRRSAKGAEAIVEINKVGEGLTFQELELQMKLALAAAFPSDEVQGPAPTPGTEEFAASYRRQLSRDWLTSADVAVLVGSSASNAAQWARDKRKVKKLFGVWSIAANGYVHPTFQFDGAGLVREGIHDLLVAMDENPSWGSENDKSGWQRAYWLYQPNKFLSKRYLRYGRRSEEPVSVAELDGWMTKGHEVEGKARLPAEVFAQDPVAVIALARQQALKVQATSG